MVNTIKTTIMLMTCNFSCNGANDKNIKIKIFSLESQ
jgi:hypothetical protein